MNRNNIHLKSKEKTIGLDVVHKTYLILSQN